ncbi:MAG: UbiA family prenyltransferase [Bacteroidia bacterium]|nr:UbiA family prenyltransferase [Bacteroidia bacterium]
MWNDLRYFFRISRPVNVLISLVAFGIACFLSTGHRLDFLEDFSFWATGCTICVIAAAGYWINDAHDFRIDRINKPGRTIVNTYLSVKKVITAYLLANMGILLFSFLYFTLYLGKGNITFINLVSVLLLFIYASWLKRISMAGNLVISFLIVLVLVLAYYLYGRLTMPLIWAMVFAFEITFIREITKDIQDIKGDLAYHLRTLPIQIGVRQTRRVLDVLYTSLIVTCYCPFVIRYLDSGEYIWTYLGLSVFLVQIPALGLVWRMHHTAEPEAYGSLSQGLKFLMLSGMITLFFLM